MRQNMTPSRAMNVLLRRANAPRLRPAVPSLNYLSSRPLRTRPGRTDPPTSSSSSSNDQKDASSTGQNPPPPPADMSTMLSQMPAERNNLLAPVHIPEDPRAILKSDHPATSLLTQSGVVVQRQIEMMNVFLGFEQANRYVLMDPHGQHIGYLAEHDGGIAKTMGRQWFRTHRAFTTHIFDRHQQEVLRFHRPFSWINTRIRVYDPLEASGSVPVTSETSVSTNVKDNTLDGMHHLSSLPLSAMRIIGEAHSEWAPLRRKYNLFLAHQLDSSAMTGSEPVPSDLSATQQRQVAQQDNFAQFAYIDEPFLSWDFSLKGADNRLIGSVNRNWGGLGREFFTDTGTYVLRMDAAGLEEEAQKHHNISQTHQGERAYAEAVGAAGASGMTLDQRAIMLATAVTIDFDYFSRHSHGGGIIPMPLMMGGGGAAEGGAAGGAAGAAGAGAEAGALGETVSGAAAGTAGRVAGTVGAGEGAIAGAGTMAGYEAMQRGLGRDDQSTSGQAEPPPAQSGQQTDPQSPQYGQEYDPQSPQYGAPPEQMPDQPGQGQAPSDGGDVWGSGDSDPWAEGSSAAGEGGGEGGIISKIWDMFNDS